MPFDISEKIERWRDQLLDTTKRNRLINFKTGTSGGIPLVFPEPGDLWDRLVLNNAPLAFVWKRALIELPPDTEEANGAGSLGLFDENQVPAKEQGASILDKCLRSPRLRPDHLLTDLTDTRLAGRLTRLALNSHESLTEQGVVTLYLAFGFLRWFDDSNSQVEVRSPLLLVPVRLKRDSVESPWTLQAEDEEILPNKTLEQLLFKDFRLRLPVFEEETSDEANPNRRTRYFGEIQHCVHRHDQRWEVLDEVALGTFSFQKLAMWDDLDRNRERIGKHDLCRSIAGDPTASLRCPPGLPEAKDLDQVAPPDKTFLILDADSSQHEAIEVAKRGASLVLDGPPGTGKSQTISNIIAEFLATGKTVLFVSEKAAALEVVQRRLQEKGLGDFCLACHSHKANKREVAAELGRCLNLAPESAGDSTEDLQRLNEVRRQLNDYIRELHAIRPPLGMTVYQVHGELATLTHLPSRSRCLISQVLERDAPYLRHIEELLAGILACRSVLADRDHHPWRGCLTKVYSPTLRDDIQYHFSGLAERILPILDAVARFHRLRFGEERPTLASWRKSLDNVRKVLHSSSWWDSAQRQDLLSLLNRWIKARQEAKSLREELSARLSPEAFESANAPLITRASRYRTFWSRLLPGWWLIKAKLKSWYPQKRLPGVAETLADLQKLCDYHRFVTFCQQVLTERDADLLADAKGKVSCPETFKLLELIDRSEKGPEVRAGLSKALRLSDEAWSDDFKESWKFFIDRFNPAQEISPGVRIDRAPLDDLRPWLAERAKDAHRLREWIQFCEAEREISQAGVTAILTEVRSGQILPEDAAKSFRARFLNLWLDAVYERVPVLRQFATDNHERLIERFRDLDHRAVESAAARIRSFQLSRPGRPRLVAGDPPGSSELGKLLREVNKQKRHLPLRKVFAELPNLLLRLKPCLMMSPLAVSTYLNSPDIQFDLVIFDEASQVRPHDAICAIYRGRQLIVAGDQKQLPPTSFFDRAVEDEGLLSEDEGDRLEDYESILDVCCTLGLPRKRLRWHYRSRREGLIAFANHYIYDNELVTFPSVHDVAGNPAVVFEFVPEGRWKKGSSGGFNAVEARRIAELVMAHFKQFPTESLGVIAFSQRQQRRIQDELERLRKDDSDMEEFFREDNDAPFFVKNLENVQGDERDVIFLGIGYGPDETGRVAMNFGPLNKQGGKRRLNVAVTRAKNRMMVVSSMRAGAIDLSRTDADGVKLLRAFLDYAERGTAALIGTITGVGERGFDSPFEQEVFEELTRRGLSIHTQVGCSRFHIDLAVVDPKAPGRYLLGVECDGATYHSSATARDRDRLRQEVLESLGWRFCRIWSTDWLRDRDGQVQRVLSAVEKAQREEPTSRQELARPRPTTSTEETPPVLSTPSKVPPPELVVAKYASIDKVPDGDLQEVILDKLGSYGAMTEEDLVQTVARQFGWKRTGNRIQAGIKDVIEHLTRSGRIGQTEDGRIQIVSKERAVNF